MPEARENIILYNNIYHAFVQAIKNYTKVKVYLVRIQNGGAASDGAASGGTACQVVVFSPVFRAATE